MLVALQTASYGGGVEEGRGSPNMTGTMWLGDGH